MIFSVDGLPTLESEARMRAMSASSSALVSLPACLDCSVRSASFPKKGIP